MTGLKRCRGDDLLHLTPLTLPQLSPDHVARDRHAAAIARCSGSSFSLDFLGFRFFVLIFFRVPGSRQCGIMPGMGKPNLRFQYFRGFSQFPTRVKETNNAVDLTGLNTGNVAMKCREYDTPLTQAKHGLTQITRWHIRRSGA